MDNSRTPECKFLNFFPPFSYRDLYTNRSSKRFSFFLLLPICFSSLRRSNSRERERHLSVGSRQQQQLSELFQKLSKRNGSSRRNGQKHTPRVPCIHLSRISISSRTQLLRERERAPDPLLLFFYWYIPCLCCINLFSSSSSSSLAVGKGYTQKRRRRRRRRKKMR